MTENMNKVLELLKNSPDLMEKVTSAIKSLTSKVDLLSTLKNVLAPIAGKIGIDLNDDDVKGLADNLPNALPLSADDLKNLGGDLAENAGGILGKIKDTIGGLFGKK